MRRLLLGMAATGLMVAVVHAQAPAPTIQAAMKGVIAPQAQILWDVGNEAMDDNGNPDAKRLSATQWEQLAIAGQKVKDMSLALAMADHIKVVSPGATIQGEGDPNSSSAAQVQGFVDANLAGFAEQSRKLAAAADDFVVAAKARDAAKLGLASGNLDQVCEDCHMQYWYPQQNAGAAGG
jgi:cytochrome c556